MSDAAKNLLTVARSSEADSLVRQRAEKNLLNFVDEPEVAAYFAIKIRKEKEAALRQQIENLEAIVGWSHSSK